MRRQCVVALLATAQRSFGSRGYNGGDGKDKSPGKSNFEEMMGNLREVGRSDVPRAVLPPQNRSTQPPSSQAPQASARNTQPKEEGDDELSFESLLDEGRGMMAQQKDAPQVDKENSNQGSGDSFYEKELRHAKQLKAAHQKTAYARNRMGSPSSERSTSNRNDAARAVDYGQLTFDDDDLSAPQPELSQQKRQRLTRVSFADDVAEPEQASKYVDDDDGDALSPSGGASNPSQQPTLDELTGLAADMTLLDDTNFAYFVPSGPGSSSTTIGQPAHGRDESSFASLQPEPLHIPGQPIIPPGFTRYRIDIQYQGSDFDGWDKSTEKMRHVSFAKKEGVAQSSSSPLFESLGLKPRAKKILEDALAVALDLTNVTVHACVMPESGAHVRRLTCHADIPSSITMQPRTVIQRATVWLEQKSRANSSSGGMPLAILSFYPCPDQAFDARYSSLKRVYVYRILNRIAPPLFDSGLQWHVDQYLDVDRMNRFAAVMQGTRDYGCFADPKLGHSLRKSLAYSSGGAGAGGGVGTTNKGRNDISMRFFAPAQNSAEREVLDLLKKSKQQQRDATLSRRHAGYVGEDLLAEAAGTSSTAGIRQWVADVDGDHGPGSVSNPTHKHQPRKDEFKQWSPYTEQDPYKLRKAAEVREASYVDYASVTTRTIDKLQIVRQDDEVMVWFVGKSFLRHQMRNMVSVLKAAGQGLWDERELKQFMDKGFDPRRSEVAKRFPIAPIHGLTLWDTEFEGVHQDGRYRNTDSGRTHEL